MKIHKIAFGWWEPFPMVNWVLDKLVWYCEANPLDGSLAVDPISDNGRSDDIACDSRCKEVQPGTSPEHEAGNPQFITEQLLGTPSAGDYFKELERDIQPCSSSDFALTFNTTTIKLLFGEQPVEKPSAGNQALNVESDLRNSEENWNISAFDQKRADRELILKTLREIIKKLQGSTTKQSCCDSDYALGLSPITDDSQQYHEAKEYEASKTAAIRIDCPYDAVRDAARLFGMRETQGCDWDVIWTNRPIPRNVYARLKPHQRANRFPESQTLVGKNNLAAYLTRMSGIFPREYDFFPKSWSLPKAWLELEVHSRTHPGEWFIVKPHKGCGGKGIYLTQDVLRLRDCRRMQGQVYIQRPFLIDGLKFDLRLYVLLTSCDLLRVFVYNEGLARFATVEYKEPNERNRTNKYMHLTNYSLNKHSPSYVVDETNGTLRRFSTILEWLNDHGFDADYVSTCIDDIIIKTIIAMLPTLKYNYYSTFPNQVESLTAFQIFGFDVMFDRGLKPFVLEVNGQPSLVADVPLDIQMTNALVFDTFDILNLKRKGDPSSRRRKDWENTHMGNFRKIYPNNNTKQYSRFLAEAEKFVLKSSRSRPRSKPTR